MKRIKSTKTNIEKISHPIGKTPDKHFASNCSGLCIIVQPEPSVVKSYYGHWSKIIIRLDGKQRELEDINTSAEQEINRSRQLWQK